MTSIDDVLAFERNCIGAMLLDPVMADQVAAILVPSDFIDKFHARVFYVVQQLAFARQPIDALTVKSQLGPDVTFSQLSVFTADITGPGYGKVHARHVLAASKLRAIEEACRFGVEAASRASVSVDAAEKVSDELAERLAAISSRTAGKGPIFIQDAEKDLIPRIIEGDRTPTGWSTGFLDVDDKLGGLRDGEMIVLAARPSVGKSLFAASIGEFVALDSTAPRPVLFFSMEMSGRAIYRRYLFGRSEVDRALAFAGCASDQDKATLERAHFDLKRGTWKIDCGSAMTVQHIASVSRNFQNTYGKPLIIIDYVQLMKGPGTGRTEMITNVSNGIKGIAIDLHCPIIALAQLNRDVEKRNDTIPKLSDLKDSGAIEQDADVVVFLARNTMQQGPHTMDVVIAKNRDDATGHAQVLFDTKGPRIRNLARVEVFK